MDVYACDLCAYYYDPECGDEEGRVKPGTPFSGLPGTWICPECGATRRHFYKLDDELDDDYADDERGDEDYRYDDYSYDDYSYADPAEN